MGPVLILGYQLPLHKFVIMFHGPFSGELLVDELVSCALFLQLLDTIPCMFPPTAGFSHFVAIALR